MNALKRRVSFADLQRMPEDGHRYELYDGELCVAPSPMPRHQIVVMRLVARLFEHQRLYGGAVFSAPFDIVFSEYDVLEPDVMYFGSLRAQRIRPDEYVRFAPDLVVEVVSPSTRQNDRERKREIYAKYGVPEYWIVDPHAHDVEVSMTKGGRFTSPRRTADGDVASVTVPKFIVSTADLFRDL